MIKAVVFDLDGTLYVGNTPVPGAAKKIEELRKKGIVVLFLTNAGTRSRKSIVTKLAGLGFSAKEDEIYCGSYLLARYVTEHYPGRKVFIVGERGMLEECEWLGVPLTESGSDIVAVCLDRAFNYEKLSKALTEILNGAIIIASNNDATYPTENGQMPGAGSLVAAIERASGKKAHVVGKPGTYTMGLIEREHHLKKDEILVVGDRLDTDIKFAKDSGVKSALVLTGIAKRNDIKEIRPDYVFESVAELTLP